MDSGLDVEWARRRDRVELTVAGEIDMATAPRLRDAIAAARTGTGIRSVRVDLSLVDFLDSSGLAVLAEAHSACAEDGQRMEVVCANQAVRRPLRITGLDRVLTVVEPAPVGVGGSTSAARGGAARCG
ncbi:MULTISPECIES: STAS domain-containing protein [Amycolatopsis]|uniref:Anti-sigma factor antagonist n=2 Tax=Amycolatopsis TaxID=1813 RepID=A0A1I3QWJ8_9PSEU|nr:STAS domain-containing protein [Amycolatopsis sacchari]SFJ38100.1 anti-sigma B factor antagonist [Amycolatopsis sacchari]